MADLSIEELQALITSAPSSAALLETFLELEGTVCLSFDDDRIDCNPEVLSTFYSAFLLILLLQDEMCVFACFLFLVELFVKYLTSDIPEMRHICWHGAYPMLCRKAIKFYGARFPYCTQSGIEISQKCTRQLDNQIGRKHSGLLFKIMKVRMLFHNRFAISSLTVHVAHFQTKTFNDLTRAYRAIRPETVISYLGLEETIHKSTMDVSNGASQVLIDSLTAKGWDWDSNKGVFIPKDMASITSSSDRKSFQIGKLVSSIGAHGS